MQIQPLIEGQYFHIYNRGVNGENIFKEQRNYDYFLKQYFNYCSDVLETLSYALLKNHFHFLVYVKENVEVPMYSKEGTIRLNASRQLSHFLNSYAQSINKAHRRSGHLFECPFKRKLVNNSNHFTDLVRYCHHNPQLHGLTNDFKRWEFTSYQSILNNNSILASQKVLDWFGSAADFERAHSNNKYKDESEPFFIE